MINLSRKLPLEVFTPTTSQIDWAETVLTAFDAAGGQALRLPTGEFADLPVADRARRVLQIAAGHTALRATTASHGDQAPPSICGLPEGNAHRAS
jgi:hypothetical protein